jgi:hypothetical protein
MSIYRTSSDVMSIPQELIPEIIPSQKCHMNMGLILNSYGSTVEIKDDLNNTKLDYRCTSRVPN